jgi:hypothetical protein
MTPRVERVVLGLAALAAACGTAAPAPPPAPGNRGAATGAANAALFLASTRTAIPLACVTAGGFVDTAAVCAGMVTPGDALADAYGRRLVAEEAYRAACVDGGSGTLLGTNEVALPETYEPVRIAELDPRTELLFWPAERAAGLVPAVVGDERGFDRVAAAALMAKEQRRLAAASGEAVTLSPALEVRATLRADLDGDGSPDVAWGVDGAPDDDFGLRALMVELSSAPGLGVVAAHALEWIEPLAAFDLDGDGAAELLHEQHYAEARTYTLTRAVGGTPSTAVVFTGACN